MFRSHILAAVLTACWCLLTGVAPAPSQATELLMVTLEHPPHSFSADGRVTGASTEMLECILSRMGYKPVFQILPWQRAQAMIEEGEATGIYTYTQTPARLAAAYYSNPVSFTSDVLFKRKRDGITFIIQRNSPEFDEIDLGRPNWRTSFERDLTPCTGKGRSYPSKMGHVKASCI